jgi:hypothetical protein
MSPAAHAAARDKDKEEDSRGEASKKIRIFLRALPPAGASLISRALNLDHKWMRPACTPASFLFAARVALRIDCLYQRRGRCMVVVRVSRVAGRDVVGS